MPQSDVAPVTPTPTPGRPLRADARRNHARILAAAEAAFARDGADASLEEIARQAGVGSATLHRHFASRRALLEAVFRSQVEALCAGAWDLADDDDPGRALVVWLRAVGARAAASRGLAASMLREDRDGAPTQARDDTCHDMIIAAGSVLLRRARAADAVRPEVSIADLLTLVDAISLETEHDPDGTAKADRLLTLIIDGIRPRADEATGSYTH